MRKKIFFLISAITMVIYTNPVFANNGLENIDAAGNRILNIVKRIGYWVVIIAAIYNIIGCVKEQDMKKLGRIILFYVALYASFFLIPWLLKQVEGIF